MHEHVIQAAPRLRMVAELLIGAPGTAFAVKAEAEAAFPVEVDCDTSTSASSGRWTNSLFIRILIAFVYVIIMAVDPQALQEMANRLLTLEQEKQQMASKIVGLEAAVTSSATSVRVDGRPKTVIDTKLMQKPKSFNGDKSAWSDWAFCFRAYVGAVDARMKTLLDHAQVATAPLGQPTDPSASSLDEQLYFVIV